MPQCMLRRRGKLVLVCVMLAVAALPGCWQLDARAQAQQACLALVPASHLPRTAEGAFAGDPRAFEALQRMLPAFTDEALYAKRDELRPLRDRIGADVQMLLAHKDALIQVRQALREVDRATAGLLEAAEKVTSEQLMAGAAPTELVAGQQLAMLSQRLGKSAVSFFGTSGLDPEAVFLLGKDDKSFQLILTALMDGNSEFRLRAAKAGPVRDHLLKLQKAFDPVHQRLAQTVGHLQQIVDARKAQARLSSDGIALSNALSAECAGTPAAPVTPAVSASAASAPR